MLLYLRPGRWWVGEWTLWPTDTDKDTDGARKGPCPQALGRPSSPLSQDFPSFIYFCVLHTAGEGRNGSLV